MSRSLQGHLSKLLAWVVLGSGLIASAVAFYFAYAEAQEFQDDTLRQIAALNIGARADIQRLDAAGRQVEDPESRIRLIHLPEDMRPDWLPADIGPGFHTLAMPGDAGDMRTFVRDTGNGDRLVVAQSTESRNEIALNSGLRTLIPLLILLPILVVLIAFVIRGEFTSLRRLAARLDRQTDERPTALPEDRLPDEVVPFVQAINRLLARVDGMIAEQRRFIADAAHELRTPLTALSLQAQNLAKADSAEQMRERLEPLRAGIERAQRLTVQLLDLARLQTGEATLAEVDVAKLARELIAEFHALAEAKQIDLGLEEAGLESMPSEPRTLRLILRNGLENAIKYAPQGGEVTVRLGLAEDTASIEIVDDGPGIPDESIEPAFEAFHRLAQSGEGSGLGLAIAREAARRLGGQVSIRNRDGRNGLVFSYRQARH